MNNAGSFIFYLSGNVEDDASVRYYLQRSGYCPTGTSFRTFRLEYSLPYQDFPSIREFQQLLRYRPFIDPAIRNIVMVIDLSEWKGHESEDYLEIFFRFLHDYKSFFSPLYVFTADTAERNSSMQLYRLISLYLPGGEFIEDHILTDPHELKQYLLDTYSLDTGAAQSLARMFIRGKINGLAQVNIIMEDFIARINPVGKTILTEALVLKNVNSLRKSKAFLFFEAEMEEWLKINEAGREPT